MRARSQTTGVRPQSQRSYVHDVKGDESRRRKLGYLLQELGYDRVGESIVVLDHDNEGTGATDHAVTVIAVQVPAMVTVLIPWQQSVPDDGQTVDGDARFYGLVARQRDGAADVVFAIAGNVDHVARSLEPILGEQRNAIVDQRADRGPRLRHGRGAAKPPGEILGTCRTVDHLPIHDGALKAVVGPLDICERDAAERSALDRIDHAVVGQRAGVTAPLEKGVLGVDRPGNIDRQHQSPAPVQGPPADRPRRRSGLPPSPETPRKPAQLPAPCRPYR